MHAEYHDDETESPASQPPRSARGSSSEPSPSRDHEEQETQDGTSEEAHETHADGDDGGAAGGGGGGGDFFDSFTVSAAGNGGAKADSTATTEDDDPFANFTVKADLKASHRGYGYDDEDEEDSGHGVPALPDDLDRAAEALILEQDPDEQRTPIRPAFESADEHLAADLGIELENGEDTSGFSQEAAIPWVGDSVTWDGTQGAVNVEISSLDFRPAQPPPDALPVEPELPPPPPPKRVANVEANFSALDSLSEEDEVSDDTPAKTKTDGVPWVPEGSMADTAIGELPDEMLAELEKEVRAAKAAAYGESPATKRRSRTEPTPLKDTLREIPQGPPHAPTERVGVSLPQPQAEVQHEVTDSSQDAVEADEVLRVFEQLQQETARLLGEAGKLLNSELFDALDPGESTESQMLYDVATLTNKLSDGTRRLHNEAESLSKRYHYLRKTYSRIHSAVQQAKTYQLQMCPKPPRKVEGLELGALYKPAEHVSGDFYDFVPLDDARRRWGLVLGDVSGHGMAAAMIVAMARKLLHVFLRQGAEPAETLRQTNKYLCNDLPGGMFITALAGIVDLEENTFELARAGHPAPVLYNPKRGREPKLLHVGGMALGMAEPAVFDRTIQGDRVELQDNDTLVLYSDGAFELSNKQQQRFGMKRFLDLIREFGGGATNFFLRKVHNNIQRFRAGTPQDDDLTVLVCKIRPDNGAAPRNARDEEAPTDNE